MPRHDLRPDRRAAGSSRHTQYATGIVDLSPGRPARPLEVVEGIANTALDEVCCRVQQDQLGHCGHRDDPLFEVRRQMRRGVETLTATNGAKLEAAPATSPAP